MKEGQRCVMVTGASSGIGLGTAGYHVCGSVRQRGDGERLRSEFGNAFTPLLFDVTDIHAVRNAAEQVSEMLGGCTLFGLVNNAGVCFHGPLMYQPIPEFARNIEINLTGTLIVTQAFLLLLGADRTLTGPPGRIIMMSSMAGKLGPPFLGAYAASKHGLETCPGNVATPIWDKAEERGTVSGYEGTPYRDVLGKSSTWSIGEGRRDRAVSSDNVG
ncbi:g5106 [Coccomyxa elongata]